MASPRVCCRWYRARYRDLKELVDTLLSWVPATER
jgi:hypothetical protein